MLGRELRLLYKKVLTAHSHEEGLHSDEPRYVGMLLWARNGATRQEYVQIDCDWITEQALWLTSWEHVGQDDRTRSNYEAHFGTASALQQALQNPWESPRLSASTQRHSPASLVEPMVFRVLGTVCTQPPMLCYSDRSHSVVLVVTSAGSTQALAPRHPTNSDYKAAPKNI